MTNSQVTLDMKELESYIVDAMKHWDVPGLSIAIVKDGKTQMAKGFGVREVGQEFPLDEHTLFPISGSTAAFTASALAILVGEGKMGWNDRMVDLLPEFKTADDMVTYHATVVDALANRTGLPMEMLSFGPHPELSRMDILRKMKHISSNNNFRAGWEPNILMNVAAGEIIPALTEKPWDDFVQDRLFAPIGMTDSITGPHLFDNNHNVAAPHETEHGQVSSVPYAESTNIGPATSIYSSAADMALWLTFQLNNGKIGGESLIAENDINMMRSSHIAANFDFPGIAKNFINQGLGLLISDSSSGHKIYSNGGDTEGFESYHAFLPELDLGIAVVINSTKVMPQPLIAWIIDRYTDAPRKDWVNELVPFYAEHVETMFSNLEKSRQEITDLSKKPSQSIESYAGLYQHPLLGDLTVQVANGELSFALGTSYKGALLHANHDTFFIKVRAPHLGKFVFSGPAQFRLDQTGLITSLFTMDREFHRSSGN